MTDSLRLQMMKAPQYLSKPVPGDRFRHAHLPTTLFRMLDDNPKKIAVSAKGHDRVQKVSILQDFCASQHVRMRGTQQLHGRHLLDWVFQKSTTHVMDARPFNHFDSRILTGNFPDNRSCRRAGLHSRRPGGIVRRYAVVTAEDQASPYRPVNSIL
jgi:hypothetical protein